MRHQLTFPLILSFASALALADIAPTQFIGSGITPVEDTDIRMESAEVTIVWGKPCALTATFTMVNDSPESRPVALGFPMPVSRHGSRRPDPSDRLSISFDGKETNVSGPFEGKSDSWTCLWHWYRCTNTFAPGITRVDVSTVLRASGGYTESLRYCLRTGGQWAGSIGSERVRIQFPYPVETDQVLSIQPEGYQIEGGEVRWELSDFEPQGDEFDIRITYVRPDVMRTIMTLRQQLQLDPKSAKKAIALAKHVLALGSSSSKAGFAPQHLPIEQYETLSANIEGPSDHGIFTRFYRSNYNGGYRAVSRKLVGEETAIPRILADAGYRDEYSKSGFIKEGEGLLLEVLNRDPHNAVAWNVYLANYWRFSFAAAGRPYFRAGNKYGKAVFGKGQVRAIQQAAENCPEDVTIQLWFELYRHGTTKEGLDQLRATIQEHGFRKVEFP